MLDTMSILAQPPSPFGATAYAAPAGGGPTAAHGGSSARGPHRLQSTDCERYWALRYKQGLVIKKEPRGRHIGTLVHTHMAYHFASKMDMPPEWLKTPLEKALERDAHGAPDFLRKSKEVYAAYRARHPQDFSFPVAVEEEFRARIGDLDPGGPMPELDDEIVTCRTDLVGKTNGKLAITDHKTTSMGGRDGRLEPWKDDGEWKTNFQVLMNVAILRTPENQFILGGRVDAFIINRIKVTEPFDFMPNRVGLSAIALEDVGRTARTYVAREKAIEKKIENGEAPTPNFGERCWTRYGACDYYAICTAHSRDEQAQIIDTHYKVIGHPKLPVVT